MSFTKETTADHHQVPRMRIKRVRGTIKTETRTGTEKWTHVCTGYRNIIGAPQAFAIWGITHARDALHLAAICNNFSSYCSINARACMGEWAPACGRSSLAGKLLAAWGSNRRVDDVVAWSWP